MLTKDEWMVATTCVGSAFMLHTKRAAHRPIGLTITAFSQQLTDDEWNAAADMSEGLLARTDQTQGESNATRTENAAG